MPELPEVESVRQGLDQTIIGKTIQAIEVRWPKIIQSKSIDEFKTKLVNQTIQQIKRRGKFLLIYLDKDVLISHLRMEGKYFLKSKEERVDKHTHVIFRFNDQMELRYNDVRKFGRMQLVPIGEEHQTKSILKLGPEPIEGQLFTNDMKQFLMNKTKAIKTILLDQTLVAGIGNIYADEILFDAGIHPTRPGKTLSTFEIEVLRQSIINIMQEAIKYGGSTIRTYHNMLGEDGTYQDYHKVYGKKNESCSRCKTMIEKIQLNGRGTHYCPHCQK